MLEESLHGGRWAGREAGGNGGLLERAVGRGRDGRVSAEKENLQILVAADLPQSSLLKERSGHLIILQSKSTV